ncbi:MAG: ATP-binding protein [bacterium]
MRLLWRVYGCFVLCILVAVAVTTWYADRTLRQFHEEQVAGDLLIRARVLANELAPLFPGVSSAEIDRRCKELGRLAGSRETVVLPDGRVAGDSDDSPAGMENHRGRPEIAAAMGGRVGRAVRFSDTSRRYMLYMAVPVVSADSVVAVVRSSVALSVIDKTLEAVYRHIAYGGIAMALLSAALAFYLSRRISRPLEEVGRVAARLAGGDLDARVPVAESGEAATLARTLNRMATQLKERVDTLSRQGSEQRAVLASIAEGVLAVDLHERIIDLNQSAALLLDLVPGQARGRSIQETVRNVDLQKFIRATLQSGGSGEADITLHGAGEHHIHLHGTTMSDADGSKLGVLVVLNDLTRLKRLETVRRDFVANVSHELKTPITTLKGCVETLSGATDLRKEDSERFIGMMRRHIDRLDAIVEDLLILSRIEHDTGHGQVPVEPRAVCDFLREAIQAFAAAAEAKRIAVNLECQGDLIAPMNAALLEHAVGNLIDNAIKYSEPGTKVVVAALPVDGWIEIRVTDQGSGIEKKHQERIFERFYRVDTARSRGLGGTGLGLAIARHSVLAHHGTVTVESSPGHGSTFRIRIPAGHA